MSGQKVKLEWDGEMIKHHVDVEDVKLTPKQIIDSIDHVKAEIDKMKEQKQKMKDNIVKIDEDLVAARTFKIDREKFEAKCIDLCTGKLKKYFEENKETWKQEAISETDEIISKDPNAYTDQQVENQKYVIFQKKFATFKKVAEKIPNRLIRDLIYDKPFYDNPFK